jgi:hypothetical protein
VRSRRTGTGLLAPFKVLLTLNVAPLLESFAKNRGGSWRLHRAAEPPAQATSSVVTAFALLERSCGQHPFGNPATTPARKRTRSGLCEPAFRPVSLFEDEEAQQAYPSLADSVTRRRRFLKRRRCGRNRFTTTRRPCSRRSIVFTQPRRVMET